MLVSSWVFGNSRIKIIIVDASIIIIVDAGIIITVDASIVMIEPANK